MESRKTALCSVYILWAIVYIVHMPFNCNTYWVWKFHLTTNTKVRQKIEKPQIEHCGFTSPFSGTLSCIYIYIHSVIYIYHNPGKAVSTAEACLSRSVKYSGRMETPELCPAFRARALRGERRFQTLWLSILGKRVSFKGPWAKKSGIGFNFKLNTIHRTLLPLYKHPLYDKSLCIGI